MPINSQRLGISFREDAKLGVSLQRTGEVDEVAVTR
jgi:hypothetical protein